MRATAGLVARALVLCLLAPALARAQADGGPVATNRNPVADPAEAAAWTAAQAMAGPARAVAMQAFAQGFPASARRLEALQTAMADYQQIGDAANAEVVARQVLQSDAKDVRALALIVYTERTRAQGLADPASRASLAHQAAEESNRGLNALAAWAGPAGMSPVEVTALRIRVGAVFYGALGFDRLVQSDYAVARFYYLQAVQGDPTDPQTDYQFAMANLRAKPLDPEGFWWAAKAYSLAVAGASTASQSMIDAMARPAYVRYHGSEDGWSELIVEAAGESAPPAGFTVAAAPTPAETAVQAVRDNDPADLTLPDWEFVLSQRDASPANHAAADKVWAAIIARQAAAGGRLRLPVKVITSSRGAVEGAITEENRAANRADLHISLASGSAPPAAGAVVTVVGALDRYTPEPFAFSMQKAAIAGD